MSKKGILHLRPPFDDQPDPAMEQLLRLYAKNQECPPIERSGFCARDETQYASESQAHPKHYPWPASRLTSDEMAILYLWRMKTGTPINELLRQCVQEMQKLIERTG